MRAPHVGDGAARRRGRARAAAVEEGPLHGRQGRRRVRGLHHGRGAVRPLHRARRALRRGPGPHFEHGRRLLPVPRSRCTSCAARTPGKMLSAGRSRARAGDASIMERRQVELGLVDRRAGGACGAAAARREPRTAARADRERTARIAGATQRSGRRERERRRRCDDQTPEASAQRRAARARRGVQQAARARSSREPAPDKPCDTWSSAPPATSTTARARWSTR